jgi:hypothetical protein
MKHMKRLVVAAVATTALVVGVPPAPAATSTTVALQGRITLGSPLSSGATVTFGGTCAGPSVDTRPSAGAGECVVNTSGLAKGTCLLWGGEVTGTLNRVAATTVGTVPQYSVRLWVTSQAGVVRIRGTATASNGTQKSVEGAGAIVDTEGTCSNGIADYAFVGSLTIVG